MPRQCEVDVFSARHLLARLAHGETVSSDCQNASARLDARASDKLVGHKAGGVCQYDGCAINGPVDACETVPWGQNPCARIRLEE